MANNTIEIKVLENPGENWELLLEGFLEYRKRDVVASGIAALHTTDGQKIMAEMLKQMVTTINGPVIIAWDSEKQKVVGDIKTRLIDREIFNRPGGEQPGHYRLMLEKWDDLTSRELQNITEFYESQSKEADILNRYPELDQYAMVYSCGVLEAYSKQNIGSQLMERALCELRQLDIKLVSGDFSSVYSQKIATKHGFETIVLENPADNWELVLDAFLDQRVQDVVMGGILALHTPAGQKIMAEILKQMMETINGPVIIAWDTDTRKVVGSMNTRIVNREINDQCSTEQPGQYRYMFERWDEATSQDLRNVMDFYNSSSEGADILNRYPELDQYAVVFSCGVLEAYSKRNIGSKLMEKALCELRQMDIKLVYGDFSSLYSQKIALKFGFEKICSQKYEGNFLSYHKVPDHIKQIHTENWVMVKKF